MIEIRSYRRVFDLERRIYQIDDLRLNPAGVPLRGLAYLLVTVACVAAASRLPLVGAALRMLPWYVRFAGLPAGVATVLTVIRIEGRPFHLAAVAAVGRALEPRWTARFRACEAPGATWCPGELLVLPDGAEARPRRLRYTGPGVVAPRAAPAAPLVLRAGESVVLEPVPAAPPAR